MDNLSSVNPHATRPKISPSAAFGLPKMNLPMLAAPSRPRLVAVSERFTRHGVPLRPQSGTTPRRAGRWSTAQGETHLIDCNDRRHDVGSCPALSLFGKAPAPLAGADPDPAFEAAGEGAVIGVAASIGDIGDVAAKLQQGDGMLDSRILLQLLR